MERRLAVLAGDHQGPFTGRQLNRESAGGVGLGGDFHVLVAHEFQDRVGPRGDAVVADDLTGKTPTVEVTAGDPVGPERLHWDRLPWVRFLDARALDPRRFARLVDTCPDAALPRFTEASASRDRPSRARPATACRA